MLSAPLDRKDGAVKTPERNELREDEMWGGSSDIKTTSLCQLAALETDLNSEQFKYLKITVTISVLYASLCLLSLCSLT